MPLEEVQQKIRSFLVKKKRNEFYSEWMELLRGDAFIERENLAKGPTDGG